MSPRCAYDQGHFNSGESKDIVCSTPRLGRYVYVVIPLANSVLTLCEVEVYGVKEGMFCNRVVSKKSDSRRHSAYNVKLWVSMLYQLWN